MPYKRTVKRVIKKPMRRTPLATKKYVKRLIKKDVEQKYFYTEWNSTGVTSTGNILDLCPIPQGTLVGDRVGDAVVPTKLSINLVTKRIDTTNRFRCIVFQWHMNDGVDVPQTNEILQSVLGYATQAPLAPDLRSQYTVYKDFMMTFSGGDTDQKYRKFSIRPKGRITYNNITINGRNHIYILLLSDSVSGMPTTFTSMLRYTDA